MKNYSDGIIDPINLADEKKKILKRVQVMVFLSSIISVAAAVTITLFVISNCSAIKELIK